MPLILELISEFTALRRAALRLFQQQPEVLSGEIVLEERDESCSQFSLRHPPALSSALLAPVLRVLRPLSLNVTHDTSLPPDRVVFDLGAPDGEPFQGLRIHMKCNQPQLLADLEADFSERTPLAIPPIHCPVRRSQLLFGGARPAALKAAQLLLLSRGVKIRPHREWDPSDNDLYIHVCAPEFAARPPIEHNTIHVFTDDEAAAALALARLRDAGVPLEFAPMTELRQSPCSDHEGSSTRPLSSLSCERFSASLSPLESDYEDQLSQIRSSLDGCLRAIGVPAEQMPLESVTLTEPPLALVFPIGAFLQRKLLPYSTDQPRRFAIQLLSEDRDLLEPLRIKLLELGFSSVEIRRPEVRKHRKMVPYPRIHWPTPAPEDSIKSALGALLHETLASHCDTTPALEEREEEDLHDLIQICLPLKLLRTEGMDGLLRHIAASIDVRIFSKDSPVLQALLQELRQRGFSRIEVDSSRAGMRRGIHYGFAPEALVEPLTRWISERFSAPIQASKAWNRKDTDLHIWLPESSADDAPAPAETSLDAWVFGAPSAAPRPFLCREPQGLRVSDLLLPFPGRGPHPRTPDLATLGHYVLDETTASTLRLLASAVLFREPCLLEGETSTSKTSAILFLAAHLGQPVLRLNLNGQTDTSELIGRYIPAAGKRSTWAWQDGLVVEALTRGYWLILDELNLAEAQVLERLNSVLERDPSLVLSEHDGRSLSGPLVHRDFRIFATMNPATYAGRSPLSPAFRDRFRAYRRVPAPSERDIEEFLRVSILGEGRPLSVAGCTHPPLVATPVYPPLAAHPWFCSALPVLARFHVGLASAFGASSTPASRERHAFTRRSLLSLLDFLAAGEVSEARLREALVRYYVDRVPPEDRPTVLRLLDASGLGPGTWAPGLPKPADSADELDSLLDLLEEP